MQKIDEPKKPVETDLIIAKISVWFWFWFNIVGLIGKQFLDLIRAHNVKLWDFKTSGTSMNLTWNDDSILKSP